MAGETYPNILSLVIQRSISHAHKTSFLHHSNQSRTRHQRFRCRHDSQQVPPAREADCFLQATRPDIGAHCGASFSKVQNRDGRLLEGEYETDVRVEGGKDHVATGAEAVVVNDAEDGVDPGVGFDDGRVHFFFFGFLEHGVFQFYVKSDACGEFLEELLQCHERALDTRAASVAFEAVLFEGASVLHTFSHVLVMVLALN